MRFIWGFGLTLVLAGCGSNSDRGTAAGGSAGTAAAESGASGAVETGGTSASGAGHLLYGDYGTPGTSTIDCNGTTCSPNQVCCELLAGVSAQCVDGYQACAVLAGKSNPNPAAYGCGASSQCASGLCCGTPNTSDTPKFIASSCKPSCAGDESELCTADMDCSVASQSCSTDSPLGDCH
ncbi:MAG TPA: hypothetical protein VGM44_08660 [Polyangiaceae bacterium]|jgi:hypothetical protein